MKKIFGFFCLCLFLGGVHFLMHCKTGFFRLSKVAARPLSCFPHPEKTFSYLAMGHHTYAFLSGDQKTVLKLPRHHKFRPSFWVRLPFVPASWKNKQITSKKKRWEFFKRSHDLAFSFLQKETGFLKWHQEGEGSTDPVRLIDGWGRSYDLDLKGSDYALQEYYPLYGSLVESSLQSPEKMRLLFASYFEVIRKRYAKGIVNKDRRGWLRNYGFREERAYEIDLGSYALSSEVKKTDEIYECSMDFREWLALHAPSYLPLFDEEREKAGALKK